MLKFYKCSTNCEWYDLYIIAEFMKNFVVWWSEGTERKIRIVVGKL